MVNQTDLTGKLALDANSLNGLQQAAKHNAPEALKTTAKQFEALFMNMMLKSMRDASPQDGPMDSDQTRTFTSMLDQQLSQNMTSRGIGVADMLVRQLSGAGVGAQTQARQDPASQMTPAPASKIDQSSDIGTSGSSRMQTFQQRFGADAEAASQVTGVPAKFMLSQAALETGWGKKEIRAADGTPSHNLFGIKAGPNWKGQVVQASTTEYVNGVAQKKVEKFRAYDSYSAAFQDYANLLSNNPRYKNVLANAQDAIGFAQGLQRAGYATDPHYANKIAQIIKQTSSG